MRIGLTWAEPTFWVWNDKIDQRRSNTLNLLEFDQNPESEPRSD